MYRLVRESSGNKKTSFSTAGFEPSIANFFSNFFVFFCVQGNPGRDVCCRAQDFGPQEQQRQQLPWWRGIVVIASGTEDPGFKSRHGLRFLGLYTLQSCC
jgi:hypothetical protein